MPAFITEPERQTVVLEADVFVAGAGTAGCIAAIAAARTGASVILAEKMPVPGGTFTNGGIGVNSYYAACDEGSTPRRIVGGIAYELAQRLEAAGGATGFLPTQKDHYHSPFRFIADHEVFKGVISEMLVEAGVHVYLQSFVCGVLTDRGHITAALMENKNGRSAVCAKQYIDASGDGDLAKYADLPQRELWQDYDQVCGGPTGLVFGMNGIDFDRFLAENPGAAHPLGEPVAADGHHLPLRRIAFTHVTDPDKYKDFQELGIANFTSLQSIHKNQATYINNSAGLNVDASVAENLSMAEMHMRIRILKMAQAFRRCVPGFEESYVDWASTQIGIRASKITLCDKMLSQQELSSATRFEDEIGLYGFHDLSPKRKHCLVPDPGFYGLPYRMLLPKGCENLFMTGRAVTMDLEAHMSTRNTVACMQMGQAAGVAAALCARKRLTTRQLPYLQLRSELLKQEVILAL